MERRVSKEWEGVLHMEGYGPEFPLDIFAGSVDYPLATAYGGHRHKGSLRRFAGRVREAGKAFAGHAICNGLEWGYSSEKMA
jgi:hypothetical protein